MVGCSLSLLMLKVPLLLGIVFDTQVGGVLSLWSCLLFLVETGYCFRYPILCERPSVFLICCWVSFSIPEWVVSLLLSPHLMLGIVFDTYGDRCALFDGAECPLLKLNAPLCWVLFSIPRFVKPLREQSLNGVPPIR